jgi:hypothetical protein
VKHTTCHLIGGPADGQQLRIPDNERRYVVACQFWIGDFCGYPAYDVKRFTYRRDADRFDHFRFVGPNPASPLWPT